MSEHTQQLFDRVAKHLLTQNAKALDGSGACMYRSPTGGSCAVGCLIDDKHYDEAIEGGSLCDGGNEKVIAALEGSLGYMLGVNDAHLLSELQTMHDAPNIDASEWPKKLAAIAHSFQLDDGVIHD